MKAKELMSREVASVDKDERLESVLETMRKRRVSKLVVLEKGHLVGVVTMGDIADELGAIKNRGVPASHLHASSAMRRQVPTCAPETEGAAVLKTMIDEDAALLPVVHDREVVGVVTAPPDMGVKEAAIRMRDNDVGSLPVVRGDRLVGIVTRSDLLPFARV